MLKGFQVSILHTLPACFDLEIKFEGIFVDYELPHSKLALDFTVGISMGPCLPLFDFVFVYRIDETDQLFTLPSNCVLYEELW